MFWLVITSQNISCRKLGHKTITISDHSLLNNVLQNNETIHGEQPAANHIPSPIYEPNSPDLSSFVLSSNPDVPNNTQTDILLDSTINSSSSNTTTKKDGEHPCKICAAPWKDHNLTNKCLSAMNNMYGSYQQFGAMYLNFNEY